MSSQDGPISSPQDSLSIESEDAGAAAPLEPAGRLTEHFSEDVAEEAAIENAFVGDVADDAADESVELTWDEPAEEEEVDEANFVSRLSLSDEPVAEEPTADAGRTDILVCHSGSQPALEEEGFGAVEIRGPDSVPSDRQECLSSEESQPPIEFDQDEAVAVSPSQVAASTHNLRDVADQLQTAASDLLATDAEEGIAEESAIAEPVSPVAATQPKPFWQAWMPRPSWLRRSAARAPEPIADDYSSAEVEATEEFDDAPPADVPETVSAATPQVEEPVASIDIDAESPQETTADFAEEVGEPAVAEPAVAEAFEQEHFPQDEATPYPPYNGYSEGDDDDPDEEDEAEAVAAGSTGGGWSIPLLCFGIAVIACCVIIPQADMNRRMSYQRQSLRQDLESVQAQVATNDEFLRKLAADPQLAERLAERQLKLIRPGDKLLPIAQGNTGTSPFDLVQIAPPKKLPPYQPLAGEIATLCYNPHTRLYLMGGGLFLMAAALVLSIETVPSTRLAGFEPIQRGEDETDPPTPDA